MAAALTTLRQSIAAGYSDFKHMATDPDLAPLRDLPEFKALIKSSKASGKPDDATSLGNELQTAKAAEKKSPMEP